MDWLKIFDLEIEEKEIKIIVELCLDFLINFDGWEHRYTFGESAMPAMTAKDKLIVLMVKTVRRRLLHDSQKSLTVQAFFTELNNWILETGLHYSDSVYDFVVCAENKLDEIT